MILLCAVASFLVAVLCAWATWMGLREGWRNGYFAGYGDRDDETIYGESPGTRRGRTKQ